MAEEMRLAEEFSVRRLRVEHPDDLDEPDDPDVEPEEVELLRDGKSTGVRLTGETLEAVVACKSWFVVFLTSGDFEQSLHIYMLSEDMKLLDSAWSGWMYTVATFEGLELSEPRTIRFRFLGEMTWSVEVLDKPGFRVPLFSEPFYVFRRFGIRRHFIVRSHSKRDGERCS